MVEKPIHKKFEQIVDKRYQLENLINMDDLRKLLEDFHKIAPFPVAVLNRKGDVLLESHWEPICTRFHRVNPKTAAICAESDTHFNAELAKGDDRHILYRCANGLYDAASPIIIEGQHLGNFFIGQFLLEPPNEGFFRKQAQRYGFEEEVYLEALSRVPIISAHDLKNRLDYLCGFAEFLGNIGLKELQRDRADEALLESEARHRELIDNAVLGIFQTTKEGKFLMANQRMANIFGYDSQKHFLADVDNINNLYANPEERSIVLKEIDDKGHIDGKEGNFKRMDGSPIFCNAYVRSIQRKDGETIYEGLLEDITDKKKMEAQLQQAQKMEAISTLAGGVAHEFNNALMGVMGNIELLKMDLPEDERRDKSFQAMNESGHRMSRLTDQLLAYAEGGKYQPKDLKMDDFVIETLPILEHDLNPTVRVETHFQKDISFVNADNAQMQMVLSAILTNSNEAIEDEGTIRITAENKDLDVDFTKQYPGLKPGHYVCLTIEDDGKGMDKETKDGIFEPFFTTKFQGRGMGMAAAYGIVRNHDGWISVESELGKGTVVQIYLPAIEIEVEKPKKTKAEIVAGSGTILMIEDEDVVIEVTQAMLEMLGYRVMVAKTGKDAIHIAETFDGRIDLALLDIKLPDIDGRKLYPLIMKARSNLKVIVFSGYSIDGPAREILEAGAQDFIQKPFSIATLTEKLKEVLEGK